MSHNGMSASSRRRQGCSHCELFNFILKEKVGGKVLNEKKLLKKQEQV